MGRDPVSGATRFPGDSDVACAGPQLVEDGRNVFDAHFVSENFQTSGIAPDSAYPRTAACVTARWSASRAAFSWRSFEMSSCWEKRGETHARERVTANTRKS